MQETTQINNPPRYIQIFSVVQKLYILNCFAIDVGIGVRDICRHRRQDMSASELFSP
jgi:hypothetical protein